MRVEHLVIITFPKRQDAETEGLGKALYERYLARKQFRPKTACIIRFPPTQFRDAKTLNMSSDYLPKFEVVQGAEPKSNAIQTSDNVGVYLVCHGYGRRPTILGAQYSSMACTSWIPDDYASVIATLLYNLGLRKIRKVCLMMCGIEEGKSGEPRLAELLSIALAKKMPPGPAVAGYDGYISVLWNEENDPDFPKDKFPADKKGAKLVKDAGDKRVLASANRDLVKKIKFVCINGKTEILAGSGWSDKDRGEDWTPTLL